MKTGFAVFCVGLIAMMLMFVPESKAKVDLESVMGMWLFDEEDDIIIDSSGNELNGRIVNTVEWVDGKFGTALEFKGSGFVDCGNQEALNVGKNNRSIYHRV